jgi:hypothetical protein
MTKQRSPERELGAPEAALAAAQILAQTDTNVDDWWRSCAWRGLETLAQSGRPFTASDLPELGVPDPDHPNRWGALFRAAQGAGLIVCVGFAVATRPSRHGGILRLWAGGGGA